MNAISSAAPAQVSNSQGSDRMLDKARSMGVPEDVISQGKTAIKAWAKENGKIPAGKNDNTANNGANTPEVGNNSSINIYA